MGNFLLGSNVKVLNEGPHLNFNEAIKTAFSVRIFIRYHISFINGKQFDIRRYFVKIIFLAIHLSEH